MSKDELRECILRLKPIWRANSTSSWDVSHKLIEYALNKAAHRGISFKFEEKYLWTHYSIPYDEEELLRSKGYILCHEEFRGLGMRSATSVLEELKSKIRVEPNPSQEKRIKLLHDATNLLKSLSELGWNYRISNKDIWLFDQKGANENLLGEHKNSHVWISAQRLAGDFASAFSTYLHEINHPHGSDHSSSFSYAVTETLRHVLGVLIDHPDKFQAIKREWEGV